MPVKRLLRPPRETDRMRHLPARFAAMLRRRGATLPEPLDADARAALVRCAQCVAAALCDELLRTPGNGGYRGFCPNTHYIEWRRESVLKF